MRIQRSFIAVIATILILPSTGWILWTHYPAKKIIGNVNGDVRTGYFFEEEERKDEGYDCSSLQPIIPGKARFYTSGPWVPGNTISVLWEFQQPWLIPCVVKVYVIEVEVESEDGEKIQLAKQGRFSLRLPKKPGVYAFPVTFTYLERERGAKEGRTWKNETDILYMVAPSHATCQYKWDYDTVHIPYTIQPHNGFWLVKLDATKVFPGIQCTNGKTYPFRGTFRYAVGSWYVRRLSEPPIPKEVIYSQVFKTEGLSNTDLKNIVRHEVRIQKPGRYETGFCLTSFHDKGGNDSLYVEFLNDSFPFTGTGWQGDCWRQEIHLPLSE